MPNPLSRTPDSSAIGTDRERALSSLLQLRARLRTNAPAEIDVETDARRARDEASPDAEALLGFIGGEIIPRLMLAHQVAPDTAGTAVTELGPDVHDRFLQIVLDRSEADARRFVDGLIHEGVSLETIFIELLTTAARRLGELWETDERSFGDVTIGLLRLHHVLRERRLDEDRPGQVHVAGERARILMVTACGDQHVFGLLMVSEFFRKAGWWVFSEPGTRTEQIEEILESDVFDLLGLSASCTTIAHQVGDEIERYRAASCNRQMKVLVGGQLFAQSPELVTRVGADAAAFDPREAVRAADALVGSSMVGG